MLTALPEAAPLGQSCGQNHTEILSEFPALKILKLKYLESFDGWQAIKATQGYQIMFPHLEKLSIHGCQKLIALEEFCGGNYKTACSSFPTLKVIKLVGLENFERWEQAGASQGGDTMFPHLEELSIRDCPKMTALPAGTSSLAPSVGRSDIKTRSAFPKLKKLMFRDLINFKSWGGDGIN